MNCGILYVHTLGYNYDRPRNYSILGDLLVFLHRRKTFSWCFKRNLIEQKNFIKDDVDLFGSDDEEEDAAAAKIREDRVAAYAAKKSKKPALIAKSSVLLDCKPWDDETDMKKMEELVRTIQMDGLLWGASKFVPVGYGINKLQIMCVIEDDKVSIDLLTENIQEFEDYVQSVDIAAFNKI